MNAVPLDAEIREVSLGIGAAINSALPPNWGFCLLLFPLGDQPYGMNYLSNANRADMLTALKELVANMEGRVTGAKGRA